MKRCSLRVRLLRVLLIPVVLAYVIIGVASYYSSYHEAEEIYDAQLTHFAKVLRALTQDEIEDNAVTERRIVLNEKLELHEYEKNFAYRVWLDNKIILHSSNAEAFGPVSVPNGFLERIIQGERWRFFILREGNVTVEVAERYEIRIDLIHHILEGIFLPQLLILPSLALIIWIGVIQGLRPLDSLSDLIRRRNPDNLETIEAPVVLSEIAPVVDAINELMQRVSEVLDREKQFSNYAAHELRTPLAALKTQLQVALRARDAGQSQAMFREMLPAIDRMQHLVEQLLSFVRVKATYNHQDHVELAGVCREVLKDMAPLAVEGHRDLESDLTAQAVIIGNAEMLSALVRNLVSNAIKYTTEGGHVHVSLQCHGGEVELRVTDDGVGITDKDRCNIFDSFYRVAGTDTEGCGLGLAIVKWVADMHDARIVLSEGMGDKGSCFSIRFKSLSE
ncbi:ATP-binding protein [Sulfuriflexus mobilis]|uniref:ATP-binding protein n=1 Tax=Sulfuriflexus mobilis TaxID=1811807 RepID=UPI000F833D3A|nr:ATP-binding protein [Sulfuriflexus mobilis]